MYPVRFPESNRTLTMPKGQEGGSLDCFMDGVHVVSAWRPRPEELVKLNMGEPLFLVIFGANTPPVKLQVQSPFEHPLQDAPPEVI